MTNEQKEPTAEKQLIPNQNNKLLEFQQRVSAISKDSVNPFFKSKYFDVNTVIDTIKPILNEVGLVVAQPLHIENGKNLLKTEIWDGDTIVTYSEVYLPEIADVQKLGAAITYLRRYSLVSLLLLQGEDDDDGNRAVKQNPAITQRWTPKPITTPTQEKTIDVNEDINQIVSDKNDYTKLLEQINNAKTEKELDAISENLKYYKKSVSTSQYALLRSAGMQKRKALDPIQVEIEEREGLD